MSGYVTVTVPTAYASLLARLLQERLTADYRRQGAWRAGGLAVVHTLDRAATEHIALSEPVPLAELLRQDFVKLANRSSRTAPKPLTVAEAAERRGCSEALIRRMCREGKLRAERHGREWLIAADQFPTMPEEG